MTEPTTAAGLPLWVLIEMQARTNCYCGEPKGHAGWLVCVEGQIKEAEGA